MEILEARRDGVLVLELAGRIDSTTAEVLEKAFLERLRNGDARLVVGMGGVDYISSAGLRVFLMLARKLAEARGSLVLCALPPAVRQVFDLAGFSGLFSMAADRAQALSLLPGRPPSA
jgi:anti-anti-sigma factor